jgi:hypothetical protein
MLVMSSALTTTTTNINKMMNTMLAMTFIITSCVLLPAGSGGLHLVGAMESPVLGLGRSGVKCTYHPYEDTFKKQGKSMDNAPGWCGIRYSGLKIDQLVSVDLMNTKLCNACLRLQGTSGGPVVYALAVDYNGAAGVDVSKAVMQRLYPTKNPLDPQKVDWKVVESSLCTGMCFASNQECTPGQRNLLPAKLLPKVPSGFSNYGVVSVKSPTSASSTRRRRTSTSSKSGKTPVPALFSKVVSVANVQRTSDTTEDAVNVQQQEEENAVAQDEAASSEVVSMTASDQVTSTATSTDMPGMFTLPVQYSTTSSISMPTGTNIGDTQSQGSKTSYAAPAVSGSLLVAFVGSVSALVVLLAM